VPRAATVTTAWIRPDDDLRFVAATMRQGFELRGGPPTPDEVAALRASMNAGVQVALAHSLGIPAGTGCSLPLGATTELSAISVLPNLRRRGVGSELASFLCAAHFQAGGALAWACAPDAAAAALLLGLGWQDAGLRVSYLDPAAASG
jgi:ribosomal protein S18 acetylase RimI-like enzyme